MSDTLTRPRLPDCPACGSLLSPRLAEADMEDGTLFGEQVGYVCRTCGVICDLTGQELSG